MSFTRTITDPRRAVTKAVKDVLTDAQTRGHELCRLPVAEKDHFLEQEPGRVPRGFVRGIVRAVKARGYTVSLVSNGEMARLYLCGPKDTPDGMTTGKLSPAPWIRPEHIYINADRSNPIKAAALAHEAGHVLLGHPCNSEEDSWRRIHETEAQRDSHEIPCELGAAALCRLAEIPCKSSLNYLAHLKARPDSHSIDQATRFATELWPYVEPSIN